MRTVVGERFDRIILDDLVKDRITVESLLARERLWEWMNDVLLTRLEPNGSVIQVMHRWHEDDLSGRLLATGEWEEINLPAITDKGESLWPERFPIATLRKIEATMGPYGFNGLYMGRPQPRGGMLYRDVVTYTTAPNGLRVFIGVDLSYTQGTKRDRSVAIALGFAEDGRVYVLHLVSEQVLAPTFCNTLIALRDRFPGAPLVMYTGGTESGILDMYRERGLHIIGKPANAVGDKFVRAQPSAAAWNAGGILVPSAAPWAESLISVVCGFSGAKGGRDDEVDALAAAFDHGRARAAESNVRCPAPVMMSGGGGADFSACETPWVIVNGNHQVAVPPHSAPSNGGEMADNIVFSVLHHDALRNGGSFSGF